MKVQIIANPVSGGGRGKAMAEALYRELQPRVASVELFLTDKAGAGERAASESDADGIVSVGGDGTANEIVNGMRRGDTWLTILPVGTANVVARELGLKAHPRRLADLIVARSVRRMDTGVVNGRRFLLGCGAGLDAAVVQRVHEVRGGSSNYLKWIVPSVRTVLAYAYPKIRVKVDGEVVSESSTYTVVGNCRYTTAVFPTTRRARIDDGKLDVCALHELNLLKLATLPFAIWSPRFPDRRDVVYRQAETVELEPVDNIPVPFQVDGDPAGFLPAVCSIEHDALAIVAPPVSPPRQKGSNP